MRIETDRRLVLASASPRRSEILQALGIPHVVLLAPVDEAAQPNESVEEYLTRVTRAKLASACASRSPELTRAAAVLVADTTVVLDGRMLAKPESIEVARHMVASLAGRAHDVKTAFAIGSPDGDVLHCEIVSARVVFRAMDADEIDAYAASGEGLDKAGAYAVQGGGAAFIPRIEGSFSCVVGLPACELMVALRRLGLR